MPAAKSADLGWGQHHQLLRYHQVPASDRHEAHITVSYPLPAGCRAAHARAALNYLVRRHEALRTVYDLDVRPWPRQRVEPAAPLTILEVTTEDDGTPAPAQVLPDLAERPFDIGREWPIRACMITAGGRLRRLHLVFNHLSFDDVSFDVLHRELEAVLKGRIAGRAITLPPVLDQPVDLAWYEMSRPDGAVEAALAPWQAEVARLPADIYARRRRTPAAGAATAHSASLTVPSLLSDARAIAVRRRAWPSAVHLAAYAMTMAGYTAEPLISGRLYTSQREASGFRSVLTCMSYPALVSLDLAGDPPFSEVVRRAAERVGWLMTHAHVPQDRVIEMISRESSRRGQPLRVASEVNFLDNSRWSCRASRDRLTWNAAPAQWAKAGSDLYLRIYEWRDGITLALQVMDEVMDRDAVEQFLRGYARLLTVHRDPAADLRISQAAGLLGFAPPASGPMLRVGPDVVDPEQTGLMLNCHPAVRSSRLECTGQGLVAHVVTNRPVTPAVLRRTALGAVADHPAARCPDWFEITAPGEPPAAGDGRPVPPWPPRTAAEQALARAVATVNGLPPVDLAGSYCLAGGRVLRLPQVLAVLAGQGWDGAELRELASLRPLGTIASRLRRQPGIATAA
jgi:hypothetical protein